MAERKEMCQLTTSIKRPVTVVQLLNVMYANMPRRCKMSKAQRQQDIFIKGIIKWVGHIKSH